MTVRLHGIAIIEITAQPIEPAHRHFKARLNAVLVKRFGIAATTNPSRDVDSRKSK